MKSAMRVPPALGVAGLLLLLGGCSAPVFPELVNEKYDSSTSLLVATHDGVEVFMVWPVGDELDNQGAPCLAIGPPDAVVGCGGWSLTVAGPSGTKYWLHLPEQRLEEGWIPLTENVSVLEP